MEESSVESFSDHSRGMICQVCRRKPNQNNDCCGVGLVHPACDLEYRRGAYVWLLREAGLDPIGLWASMATKSVIEIVQCLDTAALNTSQVHCCTGNRPETWSSCPLVTAMWHLKADISGRTGPRPFGGNGIASLSRGLCLECIKAGRETTSLAMKPPEKNLCTVKHGELCRSLSSYAGLKD